MLTLKSASLKRFREAPNANGTVIHRAIATGVSSELLLLEFDAVAQTYRL
jgi:hypothetical protein